MKMKKNCFVTKRRKTGRRVSQWTEEQLALEASRYKTRTEMQFKDQGLYQAIYHRGLMDKLCAHMPEPKNRRKHLIVVPNMFTLLVPALEAGSLQAFRENHRGAYDRGRTLGIDYQELFEKIDDADYLKGLIKELSFNAAEKAKEAAGQ